MRMFLGLVLFVLLLGPLRPWVARHWALLLSILAGAGGGFMVGALVLRSSGGGADLAMLPLLGALIGAVVLGDVGPAWLRRIEKDGNNDPSSGRH